MEKTSNRFTVRRLAVTGLLSALVFVFSWIQIPIGEVARIHLGNVFCALSGLLFGPLTGRLASGLRQYAVRLYESAVHRGKLDHIHHKIFHRLSGRLIAHRSGNISLGRDVLGASVGSVTYVALYLLKSFIMKFYIEGQALGAVQTQLVTKGVTSLINAVLAVVVSVLLAKAVRPALRKAGILSE